MNVAEPVAERHNIFEAANEDIFQAVMGAKAAQETNGEGSDGVDTSDQPVESGATRNEALRAAQRLDDPFVRKLVNAGFIWKRTWVVEMQRMEDTKLTSYFKPQ